MASSQTLPSPHRPRAPASQVSQSPRVTPKAQNLPNSSDIAKYLSAHQIVSCRQNDPQSPEPSSSPRFLQVLRNAPTNSQDPQGPFKYCQIAFRSQILRPSDSQLPTSIVQTLNIAKSQEMSQVSPNPLHCSKYYPSLCSPPEITMPPNSPNITANSSSTPPDGTPLQNYC